MNLSRTLKSACILGGGLHASACAAQNLDGRGEETAALSKLTGFDYGRLLDINLSQNTDKTARSFSPTPTIAPTDIAPSKISSLREPIASPSFSPSAMHTLAPTNAGTSEDKGSEPGLADAIYMMGVIVFACVARCISDRRQGINSPAQSAQTPGEVPEIPAWEALESAAEDAPPVDESCPITLSEFDWLEKPVRIHLPALTDLPKGGMRGTQSSAEVASKKLYNKHYNNKWYSYDALTTYIVDKARRNQALTEPTTRAVFTVNDLRQAHKNTCIELEDSLSAAKVKVSMAPERDLSGFDMIDLGPSVTRRASRTHTAAPSAPDLELGLGRRGERAVRLM